MASAFAAVFYEVSVPQSSFKIISWFLGHLINPFTAFIVLAIDTPMCAGSKFFFIWFNHSYVVSRITASLNVRFHTTCATSIASPPRLQTKQYTELREGEYCILGLWSSCHGHLAFLRLTSMIWGIGNAFARSMFKCCVSVFGLSNHCSRLISMTIFSCSRSFFLMKWS